MKGRKLGIDDGGTRTVVVKAIELVQERLTGVCIQ